MPLELIDLIIVVSYFFVVLFIGFYFARKHAGTEDYFLAGRRLAWPAVGFSLFASNISSSTLIGLCGAAYVTGISVSNYEWMAAVVLVFFAIFFIPYYLNSKVYTMPEFLERRFRPAVRFYFSGLTIINNVFIDVAGALYGGAVVIKLFWPEADLILSALLLALVAGLYTAAGGLSAVVYTDVIQAVIIIVGCIAITFIALGQVGSWDAVIDNTPPEMLSVVRPIDDATMPWLGLLTGVPILGFYFWCTNQFIVQRVLGAKNIRHARWGALFAGLLKLPVLFIMVFPGVMARQLFPDLPNGDMVFPTLITELLPPVFKGLMLAGLVAAIMSSVDSTLNSASTLITMDFVRKFKPDTSDARLTWIGRFATLFIMVVAASWTPVVQEYEGLFDYLQNMLAFLVPPVAAIFIMGMFWRRSTGTSALMAMIVGHAIAAIVLIMRSDGVYPSIEGTFTGDFANLHFLIHAGIFFALSCLTVWIVSQFTAPPSQDQVKNFVFNPEVVKDATADLPPVPWYKDYRYQSAGLILLTLWLVISYW
ncbi:MAG TPA: sodium:solute symporter [Acidobacteriota bacterium]|nr:sodium:solute symporter [Acidobacteriota bacterium]